ncbi:MAG: protein-disulfide reductase DsbD family protein [Acidobacteriota bacterium]|nr:protein-disulfide reductase DsbD family protein [Acidobacteriota bacterium]
MKNKFLSFLPLVTLAGLMIPAIIMAEMMESQFEGKNDSQPLVTVKPLPIKKPVSRGETFELTLELVISPGYHINSSKPEDELLVPVSINIKKNSIFSVKNIIFPEPVKKKFKFSDKPLSAYEGLIQVSVKIEVEKDAVCHHLELEGSVHYQACNEEACLRPATVPFKASIKIKS